MGGLVVTLPLVESTASLGARLGICIVACLAAPLPGSGRGPGSVGTFRGRAGRVPNEGPPNLHLGLLIKPSAPPLLQLVEPQTHGMPWYVLSNTTGYQI